MSIHERISSLCTRFHIEIMYVYGSRALEIIQMIAGENPARQTSSSDVDIGVRVLRGHLLSVKDKALLAIEFEDILQVNRVDLVILQEADPFLAAEIIRGERIYCRNEEDADEYDLYVLRRAGDLIPLERERQRLIFGE